MILKRFTLEHYEELVGMLYDMYLEVYPNRMLGTKYAYYMTVSDWIDKKHDIILAVKDDVICGFSLSYIDTMSGLTEPMYKGDLAYVKPMYRNSRASYLLYNNAYQYAKEIGLKVITLSRVENNTNKMVKKHFNLEETYITMEEL